MTKKLFYLTLLVSVFMLWTAAWSRAANEPHPTFDAIASQVAGKPVVVHCETDMEEWAARVRSISTFDPDHVMGYTSAGASNVVYLAPRVCISLHYIVRAGIEEAGVKPSSLSLLTLIHEAVHQKGIVNERETECASLPLVPQIAMQHFGLKEKITNTKLVTKSVRFAFVVNGKRVFRYKRVQTAVTVEVVNPVFVQLQKWVSYWHNVKPAEYKGC